jgi:hypothetical protein
VVAYCPSLAKTLAGLLHAVPQPVHEAGRFMADAGLLGPCCCAAAKHDKKTMLPVQTVAFTKRRFSTKVKKYDFPAQAHSCLRLTCLFYLIQSSPVPFAPTGN